MLTEQEKRELSTTINNNRHEVYIVSVEEMDAIVRSHRNASSPQLKERWAEVKAYVELGANYSAIPGDANKLVKLVRDLGGVNVKAYVKTYGGKPHIILKGHPGLRTILTGTKYGISNPKVVSMGLGRVAIRETAKRGGVLTIFLLTAYRVVDFFLQDEATLARLIGTLATDVVKVGITVGISVAAAGVVAGVTTIAVGPIAAVIVVGLVSSAILQTVDDQYQLTNRLIAALEELQESGENYIAQKKEQIEDAAISGTANVIEYAVDSARQVLIRWVSSQVDGLLSPLPRTRL